MGKTIKVFKEVLHAIFDLLFRPVYGKNSALSIITWGGLFNITGSRYVSSYIFLGVLVMQILLIVCTVVWNLGYNKRANEGLKEYIKNLRIADLKIEIINNQTDLENIARLH